MFILFTNAILALGPFLLSNVLGNQVSESRKFFYSRGEGSLLGPPEIFRSFCFMNTVGRGALWFRMYHYQHREKSLLLSISTHFAQYLSQPVLSALAWSSVPSSSWWTDESLVVNHSPLSSTLLPWNNRRHFSDHQYYLLTCPTST